MTDIAERVFSITSRTSFMTERLVSILLLGGLALILILAFVRQRLALVYCNECKRETVRLRSKPTGLLVCLGCGRSLAVAPWFLIAERFVAMLLLAVAIAIAVALAWSALR